jgi:hypothetical protein
VSVTSCVTTVAACSHAPHAASCTPLRFDPTDPCWGGAFDGLTFDGGADPVGWLSARSWLWRPLRDVVVALRASLLERYGAQAAFQVEAGWYDGESRPDVALYVSAPVFPYVNHGYDSAVSDAEVWFVVGEEGKEPPPHADLVAALERPVFDGHSVREGIRVSVRLMAEPEETEVMARAVKVPWAIEGDMPAVPCLGQKIHDTVTTALRREADAAIEQAFGRELRGKSATGDAG